MAKARPYTQWTLKYCRELGRYVWKVEYWNIYAKRRIDAFNFIDILVIDPIDGIVAVQSCGPSGHSEHRKKILHNDYAARWIMFAKIEIISWRKLLAKRGGKKKIWTPRIEVLTKQDFVESAKQMRLFQENLDG